MSTYYTGSDASSSSRALGRTLAQIGSRLYRTLVLWQARSEQRTRLRDMSDHELTDIGITRGDAFDEARKPFWKA